MQFISTFSNSNTSMFARFDRIPDLQDVQDDADTWDFVTQFIKADPEWHSVLLPELWNFICSFLFNRHSLFTLSIPLSELLCDIKQERPRAQRCDCTDNPRHLRHVSLVLQQSYERKTWRLANANSNISEQDRQTCEQLGLEKVENAVEQTVEHVVSKRYVENYEFCYFYGAEDGEEFEICIGLSKKPLIVSGHLPYPVRSPDLTWSFLHFDPNNVFTDGERNRRYLIGFTLNKQIIAERPLNYFFIWNKEHSQWFDSRDEMDAYTAQTKQEGVGVWQAAHEGVGYFG